MSQADHTLLNRARSQFAARLGEALPEAAEAGLDHLLRLCDDFANAQQAQERQEAFLEWRKLREAWVQATRALLDGLLRDAPPPSRPAHKQTLKLELEDAQIVERKIGASRMAMFFQEETAAEFNDLRLRVLHAESRSELDERDVFDPQVMAMQWVKGWEVCQGRDRTWELCHKAMAEHARPALLAAYAAANAFLIEHGVMAEIDFRAAVKRSVLDPLGFDADDDDASAAAAPDDIPTAFAATSPPPRRHTLVEQAQSIREQASQAARAANALQSTGQSPASAAMAPSVPAAGQMPLGASGSASTQTTLLSGMGAAQAGGSPLQGQGEHPVFSEKRKSQHVVGQLVQMLKQSVGLGGPAASGTVAHTDHHLAPGLSGSGQGTGPGTQTGGAPDSSTALRTVVDHSDAAIPEDASPAQVVGLLREQSASLKRKAATQAEKATIEIVALMFQSILTEERIPSAVRVLFARLQMPVIRVALAEPDFFNLLEHPARKLIDRMGSCVLGLDASAVNDDALIHEIRRIVQTIEQYPDTGHRVFKLVLGEFEKFLKQHLSRSENSRKLMGVAQQVELRETLSIQYTIEIRNLIKDVAISEQVREFMLKTWSEVLAVASVRHGKNGSQTRLFKDGTSKLIWAAGAKPLRADRMKMIAEMPALLQLLREGMEMINLTSEQAQQQIDALSLALGETFKVRTEAIDPGKLNAISERLQNLEEFFTSDDMGDLPINPEDLELMFDMDAQALTIILDTPQAPSEAAKHWANEIELGKWFVLEHLGVRTTVQYAWRSDMRQLHLLASADGRSYLMQARALATYLELQRLAPMEEESLSVRATRKALDKINANPQQLLQ